MPKIFYRCELVRDVCDVVTEEVVDYDYTGIMVEITNEMSSRTINRHLRAAGYKGRGGMVWTLDEDNRWFSAAGMTLRFDPEETSVVLSKRDIRLRLARRLRELMENSNFADEAAAWVEDSVWGDGSRRHIIWSE